MNDPIQVYFYVKFFRHIHRRNLGCKGVLKLNLRGTITFNSFLLSLEMISQRARTIFAKLFTKLFTKFSNKKFKQPSVVKPRTICVDKNKEPSPAKI